MASGSAGVTAERRIVTTERRNDGSLQTVPAQGTCTRSMQASMVGQLPRQAREPGEVGESRSPLKGGSRRRPGRAADSRQNRNVRRTRPRTSQAEFAGDVREIRGGVQAATRPREGLGRCEHDRLPTQASDRALRRSADRGDSDGRHRGLRGGLEEASHSQRSRRSETHAGVDQPNARTVAAHAQLGRRSRVSGPHAIPTRHRGSRPTRTRGQQAASACFRAGRSCVARRRLAASPIDDHRGAGHRHATRRDARAQVRRCRLGAALNRFARRDD